MKHYLLFTLIFFSIFVNATIYLVEQGSTQTWRSPGTSEVVINLTTENKSLPDWFNAFTFTDGDQVWVSSGTYTFNRPLLTKSNISIYGGFSGSEISVTERSKPTNGKYWEFGHKTIFDGNNTIALINAGGTRSNVIYDGLTFTKGALNAVRLRGSEIVQNCIFQNNVASGKGAALMLYQGGNVRNSFFLNNSATGASGEGGAIAVVSLTNSNSVIESCEFHNNNAALQGCAIFIETSNAITVKNCLITESTGPTFVYIKGNCNFHNNTFVNNGSNTMFISGTPSVKIYNTVIWGASTNIAGGATPNVEVKHSAFMNNPRGEWTISDNIKLEAINIGDEPGKYYPFFTDPTAGNYTLAASSSLINTGNGTLATVATDFFGVPRPFGGIYDIGYCEIQTISSNVTSSASNINIGAVNINSETEFTIDQTALFSNINIEPGGKLSRNAGVSLSTNGLFMKGNADVIASFVDKDDFLPIYIDANIEQTFPTGRQWWYLSSPLSGANSNVIRPLGSDNLIGDYNEATTSYSAPFAANSATPLVQGKGYVVRFPTTESHKISFIGGSMNSGDIDVLVTRTGTTAGKRGFNLVGNPYPSYINWNLVYDDAIEMRNAVWLRTHDGTAMSFYTYSDGDGVPETTSPLIAPMQAFWVKVHADNSTPSLTFKNAHRSHFETGANPLLVKSNVVRPRLRIVFSNDQTQDETLIVGKEYASNELDSYDIEKLSVETTTLPEIFTLVQNEKLVINSMNQLSDGAKVQLGLRPNQHGIYALKVTQLDNIDARVILIDNQTFTERELSMGSSYLFSFDGSPMNDRFSIEFRSSVAITSATNTVINPIVRVNDSRQISVRYPSNINNTISVFNLSGQQLVTTHTSHNTEETVLCRHFDPGVYFVRINNDTYKLIIN